MDREAAGVRGGLLQPGPDALLRAAQAGRKLPGLAPALADQKHRLGVQISTEPGQLHSSPAIISCLNC